MSHSSRAETRHQCWRHAIRKQRLVRALQRFDWYDNLHQYSKNKIHCSCPLCRAKTRNKGKHRSRLAAGLHWDYRDQKRIDSMNQQLNEVIFHEEKEVETEAD